MSDYRLGVIGGGNMAEAILRGAIAGGFLPPADILVSEPDPQRRKALAAVLPGVRCVDDNPAGAACPAILLAVKPQAMAGVLAGIAPAMSADAMVISIAAGISTAFIGDALKGKGRIIRVMPNTPMLVGRGMSALCPGPRASDDDMAWAAALFAASGKTCRVSESQMDAVTAVSGSGPAYFFYLVEAMVMAGVAEGLDVATATALAAQTCLGAAEMLARTGLSARELRAKVTSPNGTTQRAIETLDAAGAKDAIVTAVRAAAHRSRELGA